MPKRINRQVYDEIQRRVLEGSVINAAQLHGELCDQFPDSAPSERTVRNIVAELMPPDPSGPWQPGPGNNPQEDARVLDVWAEYTSRTATSVRGFAWITRGQAHWIAWLRAGWPDLDVITLFVLSLDYRSRRDGGRDTHDLDSFLAFAPWRSLQAHRRWERAVKQGWVVEPFGFYGMTALVQAKAQDQPQDEEQAKGADQ